MRMSAKGNKVRHGFEKLRLKAYRSFPDEPWTIGWGLTSNAGVVKVTQGMTCTKAQADAWDAIAIKKFEDRVNKYVTVPLTQGQFDALVDFDYTSGAISKASFVKKLNAGNYDAVPAGLMLYVNSGAQKNVKGLINRRKAEIALWNDGMQPKTKNKIAGGAVGIASVTGAGASVYDSSDITTQVQPILDAVGIFGYSGSTVLAVIGSVITIGVITFIGYKLFTKEN